MGKNVGRDEALHTVGGGQFISLQGCEGLRFRYGFEEVGGEIIDL